MTKTMTWPDGAEEYVHGIVLSEPGYWQFHPFIVIAYGDKKRRGKRGDDSRWLRAEIARKRTAR